VGELAELSETPASPEHTAIAAKSEPVINNERTTGRTNDRTNERPKVRHSFDIYRDQLLSLAQIQAERFRESGRKPKVGELVQEAIDQYVAATKQTNDRTNERPD
jgi:hypothetical protein